MPSGADRSASSTAYLLIALAGLCWSGNHVLGRAIAGHVPPMAISAVRWLVPALVLWPLARHHVAKDWPELRSHWRILLFLSLIGGTLFGALQYVGLQYTTAINVSVLNSLAPVLIVAAGTIFFRDRIAVLQVLGIAVSMAGVLTIVSKGNARNLLGLELSWGDLIILLNMGLWAVYSVYLRRRPAIHWLSFTFVLACIAAVTTLPFWVWEHAQGMPLRPTALTAGALAYVSIFPSLVAYVCWNRGVELIGASRAGVFLHLIPIYSAVLASLILGEEILIYHIAGFILILTGVWLAGRKP